MKIRALTSFSLGGGIDAMQGEVFEMPDVEARTKLRMGWVEVVQDEHPEADAVIEREPEVEHREPRTRRGH